MHTDGETIILSGVRKLHQQQKNAETSSTRIISLDSNSRFSSHACSSKEQSHTVTTVSLHDHTFIDMSQCVMWQFSGHL